MSEEWYHAERGGEKQGPFSLNHLRNLLDSAQIDPTTLIWRKGMSDWQAAKEVEELQSPPPVPDVVANPYDTPRSEPNIVHQPLPVKPAKFWLYLGTQIGALVILLLTISRHLPEDPSQIQSEEEIFAFLKQPDVMQGLFIASACYLFSTILSLVYLYRAWFSLGARQQITPLLAVGLMCVPFVNIAWRFVAFWWWSRLWNIQFRENGAPVMPEGIFLAFCVAMACVLVHPFSVIAAIPLMWLSTFHLCSALNYSAESSGPAKV